MRYFLPLLVLSLLASPCASAADKPVMTWMVLDLPPGSMPVNGKLTDGVSDVVMKLIFEAMPDLDHRVQAVNASRAQNNLAEGVESCFGSSVLTPERERIAYVTQTNLVPPVQLVVRADAVDRLPLNERGEVIAARLFDQSDMEGLVVAQRSYSPLLDSRLHQRAPSSGVRTVLASEGGVNILKMLKLKRADYTLEYDFVLSYLQSRNPELTQGHELRTLALAGTQPFAVGIACPHTEWGRKMITRIDAVVSKISSKPEFRNATNRWLTPDSLKRHAAAQDEFFQRRAKPAEPGRYPAWPNAR